MRAMVLERARAPLAARAVPVPEPAPGQVLLRVLACGVCRTDLHIADGELEHPKLPLVLGHEIVGEVTAGGGRAAGVEPGARVGVPCLGSTDGTCRFCRRGRENLCDGARFTGYTVDGGYAEYAVADARFCFPLDEHADAVHAAPLLCAGLIGYRTYRLCGPTAERIGIYGFGAAAHIVTQVAVHEGRQVYAFTRAGDAASQEFARGLGATWAGGANDPPPEPLDAAMIFAPVGDLVRRALRAVDKGGVVVCGGIHMTDIPPLPYSELWEERVIRSVANLTREDGRELLALAPHVPVRTDVESYPLEAANDALDALRSGRVRGAAVLVP